MAHSSFISKLPLIFLILSITGCMSISTNTPSPDTAYPNLVIPVKTNLSEIPFTKTPIHTNTETTTPIISTNNPTKTVFTPNNIPPYTPTPDPNAYTISVKIIQNDSQEEIARILYSKWLDHFLSKSISDAFRLDEYVIDEIIIPFDQRCAKVSGGVFFVYAFVTLKPTLPVIAHDLQNRR